MNKRATFSLIILPIVVILLFTIRLDFNPFIIVPISIVLAIIGIILALNAKKTFTLVSLIILHSVTLTYLFVFLVTLFFFDARVHNG
ncbi:hypothetical protein ACA30_16945 [Virgibacillus soli]|uniref:Uncharacterized protein n=1 Tax=Lederbergia galactosidilytica TaxID=217031 RepID=A0A0Q9XXY4_9BACI|nr:hypothetical protein ACA29_12260 [Lederbergia galactosidilytica]KRG12992.1 hypothetical protein ACA30_16945 [Virgibacillus soli]